MFYPEEIQGVGRVFSMELPGTFEQMVYDPDIQMSLIFGASGGLQSPFVTAQNSSDADAALRDPGVTAGIAIGVIAFVGLLILAAIFVRRRQLQKEREASNSLRSKLGSATSSEPTPSLRLPADEKPATNAAKWSRATVDRSSLTNA